MQNRYITRLLSERGSDNWTKISILMNILFLQISRGSTFKTIPSSKSSNAWRRDRVAGNINHNDRNNQQRWHCPQEITCPLHGLKCHSQKRIRFAWVVRSIVWNSAMLAHARTSQPIQSRLSSLSFSLLPLHSAFLRRHCFRRVESKGEREIEKKEEERSVGGTR